MVLFVWSSSQDRCDRLLLELQRARPATSDVLRLPLPLPFALWRDKYRREEALRALQDELLQVWLVGTATVFGREAKLAGTCSN